MVDLNSLLAISSGWNITAAYGINNFGDIVADATLNGQAYAVALDPIMLQTALDPIGLNNAITATLPSVVPEPAPLLLTAGGLLFIGRRVWYRRRSKAAA